ncbi:P-loop containing nucleoside triphosphate hydrolase protein [Coemansia spiralis]|nr:P-loop containing nucleoside triphosphate hydrolase protein [Coemansia spiralis]
MSQDNNIKVIARFRPSNSLEKKSGGTSVIEIEDETTVGIKCDEHSGSFTYDRVFGSETTQSQIYNYAIRDTLEDIFNGYNGTVFCYGQTGSGKTFTMMGADIDNEDLKGIIPRIVEGMFAKIIESPPTLEYMVKASYMEIYMERIRDLLNPDESNLPVHEDKANGVYVKGLMEVFVSSIDEVYQVMRQGAKNRVVAYTNMNAESSRSHSIFQITIEQKDTVSGKTKMGRLFLVDLAGSEKVGKTGATGQTLEEAKKINKSLSALGMVINSLTDGKSTHIPYRDSKLTRILQESLGGNSRTTLIINCSPSSFNASETVSTLRFGMRAKSIRNKAKVNQDFSPAELKLMLKKSRAQCITFQTYISALEGEVKIWRSGGSVDSDDYTTWEKILGKEKHQQVSVQPPSTPSRSTRPLGAMTPRTGTPNTGRHSVSAGVGNSLPPLSPTPTGTRVGSPTPMLGIHDSLLSELGSRSGSPTTVMSEDEREEFLRRENELNDIIAEKDHELQESLKMCNSMRGEIDFLKSDSGSSSRRNEELATEIGQLRLELEKVSFGHKEAELTIESLTEANGEMTVQLSKLKDELNELRREATGNAAMDKEKERAARVAAMLNDLDSAKAISRHEVGMGALLRSIVEAGDDDSKKVEMLMQMRREIDESRDLMNEKDSQINELKQKYNEQMLQCSDIDAKYEKLLTDYEDMLEQSIHAEEQQSSRDNETINDLKQKLEAHYNNKLSSQKSQLDSLQSDLQRRVEEISKNAATIRELRSDNRELQARVETLVEEKNKSEAAAAASSSNAPIGSDVATATEHAMLKEREMHAMRREMAQRILEYDTMRKSLMRDVQDRCEKIIELEMALDDARSQVSQLSRRANNPGQPQRMQLLEKNVAQLTLMQKELVVQNTEIKKQAALYERKLQARTERITYLECRLQDVSNQAEAWKRKAEELQNMRNHESSRTSVQPTSNNVLRFSRIAKPLRGGGGNASQPVLTEEKTTGRSTGFFSWGGN